MSRDIFKIWGRAWLKCHLGPLFWECHHLRALPNMWSTQKNLLVYLEDPLYLWIPLLVMRRDPYTYNLGAWGTLCSRCKIHLLLLPLNLHMFRLTIKFASYNSLSLTHHTHYRHTHKTLGPLLRNSKLKFTRDIFVVHLHGVIGQPQVRRRLPLESGSVWVAFDHLHLTL